MKVPITKECSVHESLARFNNYRIKIDRQFLSLSPLDLNLFVYQSLLDYYSTYIAILVLVLLVLYVLLLLV